MSHDALRNTLRIAIRKFGPFESAIQKQYADFQQAIGCPLQLEYESLDLNPLYDTLFTNDGLKDGSWDIAFVVTDWLAEAVQSGALLDIAPLAHAQPIPDYPHGWSPSLTQFQQIGEALYGIPYHNGPECFMYRRDLFEDPAEQVAFQSRFGYALTTPRTWDEFRDMAQHFNRPEQGLYGTVFAAYPDGHNTVYDFCMQLWSRGGELHDAHGMPTLYTLPAIAALNFYRAIVNDGTTTLPNPQAIDSVKSGEIFAAGKVAMMVNWFGFAAVCEQPGCPVKGKVAIASLPSTFGNTSAPLCVYWLLAVGAGSTHKAEAYAFLRHVCQPHMDKLTTLEGAIGTRLSTWGDPDVNALIPFYHRHTDLSAKARVMPRSRALPQLVHVIDKAVQRALSTNDATEIILREAQLEVSAIKL